MAAACRLRACLSYSIATTDLVACMRLAALGDCSPLQIEVATCITQLRLSKGRHAHVLL